MAVINAIPGIEASIEVGRQQLQEYQPRAEDNHDNDNQVTRYVVAEPGQEFCVVVKRDESFLLGGPDYDVMCYLFIDGKHVWGIPIRKEEMAYYKIVFTNMKETLADGRRTKRNFLFSELMFDNDQNPPKSVEETSAARKMGAIQIKLWHGLYGPATRQNFDGTPSQLTIGGPVHEKALKGRAMSRSIELGQAQIMADVPRTTDTPAPPKFKRHGTKAFAVFTFKYRSLDDLKTELIIPRDLSPGLLEERHQLKAEVTDLRSSSPILLEELPQASVLRSLSGRRLRTRAETARATILREEPSGWRPRTRAETARVKAEASQTVKRERPNNDAGAVGETEEVAPQVKRQRVIEMIDLTGD